VKKLGENEAAQKMQEIWGVEAGICEGDVFSGIEGSDSQGKKTLIKHTENQVLMVDVWATWCGYCHAPMQENVDIMSKHPELAQKGVSIVGISCDKDVPKWKSFISTKGWTSIPQFHNADAMNIVGVRGIPFVFLCDKTGKVVYQGHPMSIDLHKTFTNLLEGKGVVKKGGGGDDEDDKPDQNSFWNDLDIDTKKTLIGDCNNLLKTKGLTEVQFLVNTKNVKNLNNGKVSVRNIPILWGLLSQSNADKIDLILIELQQTYNFNGVVPNIRLKA